MRKRPDWSNYFLDIADNIASRSTCIRAQYGAVIVSPDNTIVSTGYNGAPSHVESCYDKGSCIRNTLGIAHRDRYEICYSVHAEANALIRSKSDTRGCDLYIGSIGYDLDREPCFMCKRMMLNAGIIHCIWRDMKGEIVTAKVIDAFVCDLELMKIK